jgi:hypothetical protein
VLVAGGHQLEEQVRRVLLERQVADLVHDDQCVTAEPGQLLGEVAVAVGAETPGLMHCYGT